MRAVEAMEASRGRKGSGPESGCCEIIGDGGGIKDDRSLSFLRWVRIMPLKPKPAVGPSVGESAAFVGED